MAEPSGGTTIGSDNVEVPTNKKHNEKNRIIRNMFPILFCLMMFVLSIVVIVVIGSSNVSVAVITSPATSRTPVLATDENLKSPEFSSVKLEDPSVYLDRAKFYPPQIIKQRKKQVRSSTANNGSQSLRAIIAEQVPEEQTNRRRQATNNRRHRTND